MPPPLFVCMHVCEGTSQMLNHQQCLHAKGTTNRLINGASSIPAFHPAAQRKSFCDSAINQWLQSLADTITQCNSDVSAAPRWRLHAHTYLTSPCCFFRYCCIDREIEHERRLTVNQQRRWSISQQLESMVSSFNSGGDGCTSVSLVLVKNLLLATHIISLNKNAAGIKNYTELKCL